MYQFAAAQQTSTLKLPTFYQRFQTEERAPVDTGRKLNVHKTFRRPLGRLLKVLCRFNLRPVSTGNSKS